MSWEVGPCLPEVHFKRLCFPINRRFAIEKMGIFRIAGPDCRRVSSNIQYIDIVKYYMLKAGFISTFSFVASQYRASKGPRSTPSRIF